MQLKHLLPIGCHILQKSSCKYGKRHLKTTKKQLSYFNKLQWHTLCSNFPTRESTQRKAQPKSLKMPRLVSPVNIRKRKNRPIYLTPNGTIFYQIPPNSQPASACVLTAVETEQALRRAGPGKYLQTCQQKIQAADKYFLEGEKIVPSTKKYKSQPVHSAIKRIFTRKVIKSNLSISAILEMQ